MVICSSHDLEISRSNKKFATSDSDVMHRISLHFRYCQTTKYFELILHRTKNSSLTPNT